MARILSSTKLAIDTAFDKLLRIAGLPENYLDFSFAYQINNVAKQLATPITITVDPVNGVDGTVPISEQADVPSVPFKTVQAALSALPDVIRTPVTISLVAGNHRGFVCSKQATAGAYLEIAGTMIPATVATGVTSGVIASNDGGAKGVYQLTVTGANWTVGDLVGKYMKFTSGVYIGKNKLILDNTATTVTLGISFSPANGDAFVINQVGSSITDFPLNASSLLTSLSGGLLTFNANPFYVAYLLNCDNVYLSSISCPDLSGSSIYGGIEVDACYNAIVSCCTNYTQNGGSLYNTSLIYDNCYIQNNSKLKLEAVSLTMVSCRINGDISADSSSSLMNTCMFTGGEALYLGFGNFSIGRCYFKGCTTTAIFCDQRAFVVVEVKTCFDNNANIAQCDSGSYIDFSSNTTGNGTGNTHGVLLKNGSKASVLNNTNYGDDGVSVDAGANYVSYANIAAGTGAQAGTSQPAAGCIVGLAGQVYSVHQAVTIIQN